MAFGQRADVFISSWGIAPGYGEGGLRPESQTAIAQFGRHQSAGVEGCDSGTTSPTAARFANKSGWPTESPRDEDWDDAREDRTADEVRRKRPSGPQEQV
jgi:hypothetical protein